MIKQEFNRIDPKRRNTIDYKKKQFASPAFDKQEYHHRLNIYETPPIADITLEDFEKWAIDRLRSKFFAREETRLAAELSLQFSLSSKHAPSATKRPKKQRSTSNHCLQSTCHYRQTHQRRLRLDGEMRSFKVNARKIIILTSYYDWHSPRLKI